MDKEFHISINNMSIKVYSFIANENENSLTILFLHDSLGCIKLWKNFPKKNSRRNEVKYYCLRSTRIWRIFRLLNREKRHKLFRKGS